uniref:MOSC domain-containing protein n=1 Tax=Plectus sambesii TaxID=2011161 RepID=A0A914UJ07_9BILA
MRLNTEVALAAGISAGALIAYELSNGSSWFRLWLKDQLSPMVRIGTVAELYIHPIKSCRAHMVNEALCTDFGLVHDELRDRNFLIIDATTKKFLTARQLPKMVLVETEIRNNKMTLMFHEAHSLRSIISINLDDVVSNADIIPTVVWGTNTNGYDCGDEIGEWLQKSLGSQEPLRLLYFVPGVNTSRKVVPEQNWQFNKVPQRSDEAAYADLASYMAVSQASLDNLNSKFEGREFSMRNFRPNIVVGGCPEFDEDRWDEIRIGSHVRFTCFKPCSRCVLTTVDPRTGVKGADVEPLKTLRQYRLAPGALREIYKQSPIFGVNMGVDEAGEVKVGDPVFARYKPTPF